MLMPRKVKHRKQQRGRMTGNAKGGVELTFGDFGIHQDFPVGCRCAQAGSEIDHTANGRVVEPAFVLWLPRLDSNQ